uniref:Post-GPI attachment to proteins factor 3 n=1 Tax=viral metagenome TaxID=1070528 RepID=A0A6C0EJL4_9ZZZZ
MFTNINLWMAVGNIADYLMYYFRSEQWNINESSGFIENNPILNDIIKEPINSISNLSYYLLCIVPTHLSKKYTLLHQTQLIAVNTMMYGSIFMHASNKHYGGFLDVLGMVYVFIFFIVKDLIIFGCIKNPNGRFMKLLPLSMLLIRISARKISGGQNSLGNLKLFRLMVGLKITNELKKYLNGFNFDVVNLFWSLFSVSIALKGQGNIYDFFWKNTNDLLLSNGLPNGISNGISNGLSNEISLYNKVINAPWVVIAIYGLCIRNYSPQTQKNRYKFITGIIFIGVGLMFQESEFFSFRNKPDSLLQLHGIWHILSSIGLYYMNCYMTDNLPL